jgi:hypothetical protein
MPVISRFHGIVIFMNYNAPPHRHARYQDEEVVVHIESLTVMGTMSCMHCVVCSIGRTHIEQTCSRTGCPRASGSR